MVLPGVYWALKDKTFGPMISLVCGGFGRSLVLADPPSRSVGRKHAKRVRDQGSGSGWIGQFFVPLGQAGGSIEFALMLSILAAHLPHCF